MMTRTVSSVWMALFAALVTVPQPARSEIHDPAFLAALDENAQLYVADWNAASNAFVNYRFVGAWRQNEGRAANTRACAVADFNEDGHDDIAVGRSQFYQSGGFMLFLNDGTFGSYTQIADIGDDPYAVTAGDFDLDGHPDVMANAGSSGNITFFKGLGDGTFATGVSVPTLDINRHSAFDAYDFDGDGDLDIVTATYDGRSVLFFRNDGTGTNYAAAVTVGATPNNVMCISAPPHPAHERRRLR